MTYRALRGQELTVHISRDGLSAPWGFRLHGGTDFDSPLIVQKVIASSPAADALQFGDVILKINDGDALRLRHDQALDIISAAGGTLKLTILRGSNAAAPPPVHTPSRGTTPVHGSTAENGEQKVPRLADIMKDSLQLKEQGQLHTIRQQKFRGTPITRAHAPQPKAAPTADITSYLPQLPPKRASSAQRHYSGGSASARATNNDILSPASSGRSSPSSSVIELGDPTAPKPVGVWVPPVHQPNAKLVHLQYNSPLGLYSAYNVADSVERMTGSKIEWVNQKPPSTRYMDDIRESPTYKFIQELEGRAPRAKSVDYEQSKTIKTLNRYFRLEGTD